VTDTTSDLDALRAVARHAAMDAASAEYIADTAMVTAAGNATNIGRLRGEIRAMRRLVILAVFVACMGLGLATGMWIALLTY
jgi:hypothetical protein